MNNQQEIKRKDQHFQNSFSNSYGNIIITSEDLRKYAPLLKHKGEFAFSVTDFVSYRKSGSPYVDKTVLIKKLLDQYSDSSLIITGPRRWGKSMNLSMLKAFFETDVVFWWDTERGRKGKEL